MPFVLAIQHVEAEPLGSIGDALRGRGVEVRTVRIFDGGAVPDGIGDAAGLVVMGGPMGVYEGARYPFLDEERSLIRDALARGRPILGTCLGSQLLAAALGAEVRPGRAKEIGWHEVRLAPEAVEDPLLSGVASPFTPLHWHGDVFDLPPKAVRLASSALTETQAFRSGGNAYGFVFHMEVSHAIVGRWVVDFEGEMRAAGLSREDVLGAAPARLAELERIGSEVYGRWAALL